MKHFKRIGLITVLCLAFISTNVFAATPSRPSTSVSRPTTTTRSTTTTTTRPSTSTSTKSTSSSTTTRPSTSTSTSTKSSTTTTRPSTSTSKSTSGSISSWFRPSTSGAAKTSPPLSSSYSGTQYAGSSSSISRSYYYHTDNSWDSFWSHYWLYRALTPNDRTYVVNGTTAYAPAYGGFMSVFWDIITFLVVIALIVWIVRAIRRKRRSDWY